MTNPQTSPSPQPPAYPATVPGRRVFTNGLIGIDRVFDDGICLSDEAHAKMQEMLKQPPINLNEILVRLEMIPCEKIEEPEFPLDLLLSIDEPATESVTIVGNNKLWPKLENNDYILPDDLDKTESIFYTGEEKRWDDTVGQYPEPMTSEMSNEGFLENIKDLAVRQRLLAKGLMTLKNHVTDFVGRSGEL